MLRRLALLTSLAGCAGAADAPLPEAGPVGRPIPLVHVVAGRPDTLSVSALLGPGRVPQWGEHPDVQVSPLRDGRLIVEAPAGFSGVAQVPFTVDGAPYVLAVESSVWPEHSFRYVPPIRPLQAAARARGPTTRTSAASSPAPGSSRAASATRSASSNARPCPRPSAGPS